MPESLAYPGVYVQEIPSGPHTIAGVPTSITGFVGRAARGPVNRATTINSFADFERIFGGLWLSSTLGFAVRDFFVNGGSQAIIVRLFHQDPAPLQGTRPATKAPLAIGAFRLRAASEGKWGTGLRGTIDLDNQSDEAAAALGAGITAADLFNLTVRDMTTGWVERFLNLTVKESARRIDRVLAAQSALVEYVGVPAVAIPIVAGTDRVTIRELALLDATKRLSDKQHAGTAKKADETAVSRAKAALDKLVTATTNAVTDGGWLTPIDFLPAKGRQRKVGIYALDQADLFNLLCIPPYHDPADALDTDVAVVAGAAAYCEARRAMLIVDAPKDWMSKNAAVAAFNDPIDRIGTRSANAALYFPRLSQPNPLRDGQLETFAACGAVAGVIARIDVQRGVWKPPAGLEATLRGVTALAVALTDAESGQLNPLGINCLRVFTAQGLVVWGSRTLRGADQLADEYKYVSVRRTALYIEESLSRGLSWTVFEPNGEPLWAQIRNAVDSFMNALFRQGAFQGSTPRDAYFVKCDATTMTQSDINRGVVNVVVGFAPLKPAEFVTLQLQQLAGQTAGA